ncbi:hypothetical protein BT63DRAFT_475442 [Microthyrium microscopicum]|uniref:Uncharacterized protein n=1 Tax=Microthyrium microscopicum TaxID=703497 RepID=A0A6A6UKS0_9PEZI|nr:hypothetical protein BT63DRAFT_475442 [Microthyrium microscopicum]
MDTGNMDIGAVAFTGVVLGVGGGLWQLWSACINYLAPPAPVVVQPGEISNDMLDSLRGGKSAKLEKLNLGLPKTPHAVIQKKASQWLTTTLLCVIIFLQAKILWDFTNQGFNKAALYPDSLPSPIEYAPSSVIEVYHRAIREAVVADRNLSIVAHSISHWGLSKKFLKRSKLLQESFQELNVLNKQLQAQHIYYQNLTKLAALNTRRLGRQCHVQLANTNDWVSSQNWIQQRLLGTAQATIPPDDCTCNFIETTNLAIRKMRQAQQSADLACSKKTSAIHESWVLVSDIFLVPAENDHEVAWAQDDSKVKLTGQTIDSSLTHVTNLARQECEAIQTLNWAIYPTLTLLDDQWQAYQCPGTNKTLGAKPFGVYNLRKMGLSEMVVRLEDSIAAVQPTEWLNVDRVSSRWCTLDWVDCNYL